MTMTNTATTNTATLLAQLRALLDLTNTEIQVAESRVVQARTEAVGRELSENAAKGRERAEAIESAIRELGGFPDVIGPFLGRAAAAVKTLTEQAQPFDEALLGDLALENQLLDRARYLKALSVAAERRDVTALAERLITAHSATVEWLTTVLAEDALGGPAALRRTPLQAAAGAAVKLVTVPVNWSAQAIDRVIDTARSAPPALDEIRERGEHAREIAGETLAAARDAAVGRAEKVLRREGADDVADALRSGRTATGVLDSSDLPITDFADLNVSRAVTAVKELTKPEDLRVIIAYEEAHKNRHGIVSAAQTQLARIAKDTVGLN